MIIKNILLLILAVCCLIPLHAAESATALLDKASAKLRSAKSLNASYTIVADGMSHKGSLTVAGDRFVITSPEISSWYDGCTQWTYSTRTGEVNITEPTPEELQQVNPFAIINSFKTVYKASLLKSAAGEKKIHLASNHSGSDIAAVTMILDANTLYPKKIDLTFRNRRSVSITVNSVNPGQALPASAFTFNPRNYPNVPVVDLR